MQEQLFNKIANNTNKQSLAHQSRLKRFRFFRELLDKLPRPLRILDIGGTEEFWLAMQFDDPGVTITLLNLEIPEKVNAPFHFIQGDATNLSNIKDHQFDLVFSNSVIEHLFTWENQQKMAAEIIRIAKWHFIQSPNYWFPIEPHWVFPFFQFLPLTVKIWLTQHLSLGHIPQQKDYAASFKKVTEIRLLNLQEMKTLFPNSAIYFDKFLGLNKSFIAYSIDYQSN